MGRTAVWVLVASLGSSAVPCVAAAQTESEVAARRLLLEQAQQARERGDHAAALDAATRAGRLRMSASLRLFITEEQASLGQTAQALGSAELCIQEAERDTATNRQQIIDACRALLTSLRTRVGAVIVRVPSPPVPGLRVTVNGQALNEALYNSSYVVSPGAVVIEATAPGRAAFRRELTAAVGAPAEVALELPVDPAAAATSATGTTGASEPTAVTDTSGTTVAAPSAAGDVRAPGAPSASVTVTTPATRRDPGDPNATRRVLGWVGVGTGGALLIGGVVAMVLRSNAITAFNALRCPGPAVCPRLNGEASVYFALGLSGLIGGGLLAGLGVAMVVTAPPPAARVSATASSPRILCAPSLGGLGVDCGGAF